MFKLLHDGHCYVVYNSSELGILGDHVPDKWYFHPYPVSPGSRYAEPLETREQAEIAARRDAVRT